MKIWMLRVCKYIMPNSSSVYETIGFAPSYKKAEEILPKLQEEFMQYHPNWRDKYCKNDETNMVWVTIQSDTIDYKKVFRN